MLLMNNTSEDDKNLMQKTIEGHILNSEEQ